MNVDQWFQQGVGAQNAGDLQEAERCYRAVLEARPKHPDANHNLGLIAVSVNQPDAALPLFKTAAEANPTIEQFWLSYIEALITRGQFEDARKALSEGKGKSASKEKLTALTLRLESLKSMNTAQQAPSHIELQKVIDHYQTGSYKDAEELASSLIQQFQIIRLAGRFLEVFIKS
jgi:thioredoxin-like negative regulator of GroEL